MNPSEKPNILEFILFRNRNTRKKKTKNKDSIWNTEKMKSKEGAW